MYCSVRCYQNQQHSQCSEEFYRKCVQEELKHSSETNDHDCKDKREKNKIIDALKRLQEGEEQELEIQNEILDSDDEDDISDRLKGVDLDDTDKIWDNLVESEKLEFQKLVESGEIGKFIPKFVPWWNHNFDENSSLIQEVGNSTNIKLKTESFINNLQEKIPKVDIESISELSKLLGNKKPSILIKFGILNVVYAYAYALKYFRGDHAEYHDQFVEVCFLISSNLRENQNFDSSDLAVESAASSVNQHSMISVSPEFTKSVKRDVFKIVKGPSLKAAGNIPFCLQNIFLLAAITDMKNVFQLCLTKYNKRKSPGTKYCPEHKDVNSRIPIWIRDNGLLNDKRNVELDLALVKRAVKKLEFYLSWTLTCYDDFKPAN